eukprot:gnl/Spiro4/21113_TR10301_c0_g1_i1.p1 gnl/Spiro4/21113_TR10301_c0_g1~~gnl/Spiro4/21113_TR10301_c0_g1_i1.p1  ORF type:complete len:327 (+),score=64.45 gnl/Spiro4/21113_TR10301_c0_g1_i1:32-982(+)
MLLATVVGKTSSRVCSRACSVFLSFSTHAREDKSQSSWGGMDDSIRRRTLVAAHSSPKSTRGVQDYPTISGTSEIHIFLAPLNPSNEWLARYDQAVEEFNTNVLPKSAGATSVMRPVYLCLNFRSGPVHVMQTARHVSSQFDNDYVIEEAYRDGKFFAERGFEVIRHKIEAYGGSEGVPLTDEEAQKYPNRYWEFHLRVNRKSDAPDAQITPHEVEQLTRLSQDYSKSWKVPVPLSYNAHKSGRQRFLNFRVGYCGKATALRSVDHIKNKLHSSPEFTHLEVGKSHIEYVWYDDNRDLDRGWIDFTVDEQKEMFQD